ncbi:GNAT family N-acetyltransferase [Robbsia sp. KACC 23696]|uniref:GNAT family N-acetyltransferase n=1 Tax=Robbsia sp. KACC 23696 TaxID=3149231 RepID=UPI00325A49D4
MIEWYCKRFDELTVKELYSVLEARSTVFVVEQRCVYMDIDGRDETARHLFARDSSLPAAPLVAYARLFGPDDESKDARIGRVLTVSEFRDRGLGKILMQKALQQVEDLWPGVPVRLNAQQYLRVFYESFGFSKVSGPYLEDGIPHLDMRRA